MKSNARSSSSSRSDIWSHKLMKCLLRCYKKLKSNYFGNVESIALMKFPSGRNSKYLHFFCNPQRSLHSLRLFTFFSLNLPIFFDTHRARLMIVCASHSFNSQTQITIFLSSIRWRKREILVRKFFFFQNVQKFSYFFLNYKSSRNYQYILVLWISQIT